MPSDSSGSYALFISHSHKDKDLADKLVDLLHRFAFEQDSARPRFPIYYTSRQGSLKFGEDFSAILDSLRVSNRVVALVTPNSKYAPTVLAEMAIAHDNRKFLPVAVGFSGSDRLSWPLDNKQICFLDAKDNLLALLSQLREHFGIDGDLPPGAKEECEALVKKATSAHPPPPPPPPPPNPRLWAACAAAVLIPLMLLGGYWVYQAGIRSGRQPRYFSITSQTPAPVGATPVHLVFSGTFPAKFLSKRLHELHTARMAFHKAHGSALGIPPPSEQETQQLLLKAIHTAMPGILPDQQSRMDELARQWNTGVRPWGDRKEKCQDLKQPLDQQWCALISELKSNSDEALRDKFDKTPFAILLPAPASGPGTELILTPGASLNLAGISAKVFAMSPEIKDGDYDLPGAVILKEDQP